MTDLHERWTYYPRASEARVAWWGTVLGWSWTHRGVGRGGFTSNDAAWASAIVALPEPEAKLTCAVGELPPPAKVLK